MAIVWGSSAEGEVCVVSSLLTSRENGLQLHLTSPPLISPSRGHRIVLADGGNIGVVATRRSRLAPRGLYFKHDHAAVPIADDKLHVKDLPARSPRQPWFTNRLIVRARPIVSMAKMLSVEDTYLAYMPPSS
jgi:hypothetical protein